MRILVIEDEADLCDSIADGLQMDGYAADTCYSGSDALELVQTEPYDLILLDLNLPGIDGLDLLAAIREENQEVKILILSARASVPDKIIGLDGGANDYLTKPFDFAELEARIRNLMRRSFIQSDTVLTFDGIALDTSRHIITVNGSELPFTRKEFSLLEYLLLNRDRTVSQEEFMEHVWNMEADSFSNAVRVHIASLRKKLKTALDYDPIGTKVGIGYFLVEKQ